MQLFAKYAIFNMLILPQNKQKCKQKKLGEKLGWLPSIKQLADHGVFPATAVGLHILQLAHRYLISDSLLCLIFPDALHVFPALDPAPDQYMTAHFKG